MRNCDKPMPIYLIEDHLTSQWEEDEPMNFFTFLYCIILARSYLDLTYFSRGVINVATHCDYGGKRGSKRV